MSDSSNIIPLEWAVEVKCSGGWKIKARFCDEAAAWTYGADQLDARVYHKGLCLGQRSTEVAGGGWHSVERFKRLKRFRDTGLPEPTVHKEGMIVVPRNTSEKLPRCPEAIAYAELVETGAPQVELDRAWFRLMPNISAAIARKRSAMARADKAAFETSADSFRANAKIIRESYAA